MHAPYGDAQTAPIHEADIAAVATASLLGDGHHARRYLLTGPESLTYRDQVALIAHALGRQISFHETPPEQARQRMIRDMPEPVADTILQRWAAAVGRAATVEPTVEHVTGRPPRTFARWAADHVDDFR